MGEPITWGDYFAVRILPTLLLCGVVLVVGLVSAVRKALRVKRQRRSDWGGDL